MALAVATSMLVAVWSPPAGANEVPREMPVYKVVQEGLTKFQAKRLAARAGIEPMLRGDGTLSFVDTGAFATVPRKVVDRSEDEDGNPVVAEAVDFDALERTQVPDRADARKRAAQLLEVPEPYGKKVIVGHTTFDMADEKGQSLMKVKLDTTVSYRLHLADVPVVGPGAKLRLSLVGDDEVSQLTHAIRRVEEAGTVEIIHPGTARKKCAALYGAGIEQRKPRLVYYAPALGADEASGEGTVEMLVPHYSCRPRNLLRDGVAGLGGRMIPAAPSMTPRASAESETDGRVVSAVASARRGTPPYTYQWSSSTVALDEVTGEKIQYKLDPRSEESDVLTLTVVDVNGLTSVLSLAHQKAPGEPGAAAGKSSPGGAGGVFAEAGIEQTVDEWQCAQDSAIGFKDEMQSQGQSVDFDWRGTSAWEQDFKKTSLGGDDINYVDEVDIQWYTGHGSANSFTFKSSVDDTSIVPNDAQWGDLDLEWLNLESCQVLRDTTGTLDHLGRWGPTFDGLHLLNGFHTNAFCITGGTGRRFAEYLFPEKFLFVTLRNPLTVQQAWAAMANDLEPAGVRWRSMSAIRDDGVMNFGDFYWGQGNVGPDIGANERIGWASISGLT